MNTRYSHVSAYIDEVSFGWRTHCYEGDGTLVGVFASSNKDTAEDISASWDANRFDFTEPKQ
jgi:hypothetical protein